MHADVATGSGGLTFVEAIERLKKLKETRSPAIVKRHGGSGIPNLRASSQYRYRYVYPTNL